MLSNTKIFKRLFLSYSAITIAITVIIAGFAINAIIGAVYDVKMSANQKITNEAKTFIDDSYQMSQTILSGLYASPTELEDVLYFLTHGMDEYTSFKLDRFSQSDVHVYQGIEFFTKNSFRFDESIAKIAYYGNGNNQLAVFSRNGSIKMLDMIPYQQEASNIREDILKVLQAENMNTGMLPIFLEMKNPYTFEPAGLMVVQYDLKQLDYIVAKNAELPAELVLVDNQNTTIYQSGTATYTQQFFNQEQLLKQPAVYWNGDKMLFEAEKSNNEIMIISLFAETTIWHDASLFIVSVLTLSLLLIALGEVFIYRRLSHLGNRTAKIIAAMDYVKAGNFSERIPAYSENDELALISNGFNAMVDDLDDYINKVYVAELKQQQAELKALQAQINPHFLYNTLEVIRMKALLANDTDVAQMLYNLAVLFRSTIKGELMVTMTQELDYCRMYLDLFRFRYEQQFDYMIDCDINLLNMRIAKFTIQPLIENAVIHGFDGSRTDNFVKIQVKSAGSDVVIEIADNGRGISDATFQTILNQLNPESVAETQSIGILNVHERLQMMFGKSSRVEVERLVQGTIVRIIIPVEEV